MLTPGILGEKTITVQPADTAQAIGSGALPVYATPAMIALMESVSAQSVAPFLAEGQSTVGTSIHAEHIAASPVGAQIHCRSELTDANGRRLRFRITASDRHGIIGEATHERFVIENERFLVKVWEKM